MAGFEVPEYSFNPAHLAGRMVACAEEAGARVYTQSEVLSIEPMPKCALGVTLVGGDTVKVDILINALGNWINTIDLVLSLPRHECHLA